MSNQIKYLDLSVTSRIGMCALWFVCQRGIDSLCKETNNWKKQKLKKKWLL